MISIAKVTCSDGSTFVVAPEAVDPDRHTRRSLDELLAAHLRANGSIKDGISVVGISFVGEAADFEMARRDLWLHTSYCDGFVA